MPRRGAYDDDGEHTAAGGAERAFALYASTQLEAALRAARAEDFDLLWHDAADMQRQWRHWMRQETTPMGHLLTIAVLRSHKRPVLRLSNDILAKVDLLGYAARGVSVIVDQQRDLRVGEVSGVPQTIMRIIMVEQNGKILIRQELLQREPLDASHIPTRDIREPSTRIGQAFALLRSALATVLKPVSRRRAHLRRLIPIKTTQISHAA
jgi:hypothetical protein